MTSLPGRDSRDLVNRVRSVRERRGLSQKALSEATGVSRQAIIAIERSGQVPSTLLALRLAATLGCRVEELFELSGTPVLDVRLPADASANAGPGARVLAGRVRGRWVAHPVPLDRTNPADGVLAVPADPAGMGTLELLEDTTSIAGNVLVSGCAPVLELLAGRTGTRFPDARGSWLPGGSGRALDLLEAGVIHVAGVHLPGSGDALEQLVRARFPGRTMLILNLTRWREGFVVAPGNPMDVRKPEDLLAPHLRFAGREPGAGAHRLTRDMLSGIGAGDVELSGPRATGHVEVANLVRCGAADVGVAIEGVALAAGLDFVPLMEERFDLVVPAVVAETGPVVRLLSLLEQRSLRAEVDQLPGYDSTLMGHVTTIEAA